MICRKCNHVWKPYVTNPKCCPSCKSYDYAAEELPGKDKLSERAMKKENRAERLVHQAEILRHQAAILRQQAAGSESSSPAPKGVPYVKGATGVEEGDVCARLNDKGIWVDGKIEGGKFIPNAPIIEKGAINGQV